MALKRTVENVVQATTTSDNPTISKKGTAFSLMLPRIPRLDGFTPQIAFIDFCKTENAPMAPPTAKTTLNREPNKDVNGLVAFFRS